MNGWAIIAVNARARCKTRLDDVLGLRGRRELAREMLHHVLGVVRTTRGIRRVAVVTPERDDVPLDVPVIVDSGMGLNAAADLARAHARQAGATELLLLAADLPLLTPSELASFIAVGRRAGFALATDRAGNGTNALFLGTRPEFRFRFGTHSRAAHCAEAHQLGLEPVVVRTRGLAADVDTLSDYCESFPDRSTPRLHASRMVNG